MHLTISLSGVLVTAAHATVMEHGLKRISYATCDPTSCLFSFLARDPTSPLRLQHCHTFRLPSPTLVTHLASPHLSSPRLDKDFSGSA